MIHCFIRASEIISSVCSMTSLLHIFHEECHVEIWAQGKTQRDKGSWDSDVPQRPSGLWRPLPSPYPSAEEATHLCIWSPELPWALPHAAVMGTATDTWYRTDYQPSSALAHQFHTETCETWLRWPTPVFPDDVHVLRVVFFCLCTSTAQLWGNQLSTAWDHLL